MQRWLASVMRRLRAVLNASARIITGLPRSAHITTSLAGMHWLRTAERIKFKLAKLTYVACTVQPPTPLPVRSPNLVADIPSRRRLRSFATDALLVRLTRLVTVGDRAVPVAVGGGCGGGGGSSSSSSSSS